MIDPQQLVGLDDTRFTAKYIQDQRFGRSETLGEWKTRVNEQFDLDSGKMLVEWPDHTTSNQVSIQNTAHTGSRDLRNIISESIASLAIDPASMSDTDDHKAMVQRAISNTYWKADQAEDDIDALSSDLMWTGACFFLSYVEPDKKYPCHRHLPAINCYPTFFRKELIDLLYVEEVPVKYLAELYPDAGFETDPDRSALGEVVDYWSKTEIRRVAYVNLKSNRRGAKGRSLSSGAAVDLVAMPNLIGRIPVAWARLTSADGRFEGLFDQMGPVLNAENRIQTQMLDATDRMVYAPIVASPGTTGLEQIGPDSVISPPPDGVEPHYLVHPGIPGEVFALKQDLNAGARGVAAYPSSRQGENLPSIISAAGVNALQGERASLARYLQRHLSSLRVQQTRIDSLLDLAYLDFDKRLLIAVENQKTYKPSAFIDEEGLIVLCTYAGGGLNATEQNVVNIQKFGAGMLDLETAISEDPQRSDPRLIMHRISEDKTKEFIFSATLPSLPSHLQIEVLSLMREGKDAVEALAQVQTEAEQFALQQAQAQAGGTSQNVGPEGPTSPEAVAKNGIPGAPQPALGGPPLPPLTAVLPPEAVTQVIAGRRP